MRIPRTLIALSFGAVLLAGRPTAATTQEFCPLGSGLCCITHEECDPPSISFHTGYNPTLMKCKYRRITTTVCRDCAGSVNNGSCAQCGERTTVSDVRCGSAKPYPSIDQCPAPEAICTDTSIEYDDY